ncbi:hypothetical protein ACWDPI_31195, partial [Streptomyces zhihengii]
RQLTDSRAGELFKEVEAAVARHLLLAVAAVCGGAPAARPAGRAGHRAPRPARARPLVHSVGRRGPPRPVALCA